MTDERVKLMGEIIEGIELIKMYGWEDEMKRMIEEKRENEIRNIQSLQNFNLLAQSF